MRVLILSQYCWPEVDHKCLPLAQELKKKGHKVEILTAYPNRPSGKIFPGYKFKLYQKEHIDGITINRVPSYLDHSHSGLKRMLSYISFAISASLIGQFLVKKHDVIFVYHAPSTIAIPAIYLKLIYRSKIFYDINDYWPDTVVELGMLKNSFLISLLTKYCNFTYKFFDNINVVSNGYKKKLLDLGISNNKISLIYNWSLPINNLKSNHYNQYSELFRNYFTIVYAGNVGQAQNLDIILDVAEEFQNNDIQNIKFFIIGSGVEKAFLENEVIRRNLSEYVIFTGFIPSDNVGQFLENASTLFLHLRKIPLFDITIPSKLVSYFIYSKPVLCGVGGESADIVSESKSGICFEPQNVSDLKLKIIKLKNLKESERDEMGKSGRHVYDNLFSFEIGTKKIIEEMQKLAN
jgi:colanic acid biosynthesis glycosyl transferase WcaI